MKSPCTGTTSQSGGMSYSNVCWKKGFVKPEAAKGSASCCACTPDAAASSRQATVSGSLPGLARRMVIDVMPCLLAVAADCVRGDCRRWGRERGDALVAVHRAAASGYRGRARNAPFHRESRGVRPSCGPA
jgi:hypothetical protein